MPLCFVIMGFGKKSDPSTGKTLDLDQTYKNIIKPAVEQAGYTCVRADEIQESGIIDKSMYALLMQAELVIADISTYNPNAIYELGIRHAVRPFSTIVLKEQDGKIPFDLDHTRMFTYAHLGEDIGADEAARCTKSLKELVDTVTQKRMIDSPLYEYISSVQPPTLPENEYESTIKELASREKHIFALVENALLLMKESNFAEAAKVWERASAKIPTEPYFIQQRALCIYKSGQPSPGLALIDALSVITQLEPDGQTNDPETLGITGAIYKNLWQISQDPNYLDRAIAYYGKCYKIRNDYYTGENYALCLNIKGSIDTNPDEQIYCRMEAAKARQNIISTLESLMASETFDKRADRKWIYATLSQCYFALRIDDRSSEYEQLFLQSQPLDWEAETFYRTRKLLSGYIK